jgi:4-hydroxy-tetrahydrodipicolinate reductase
MGSELRKLCLDGYSGAALFGGVDPNATADTTVCIYKSFSDIATPCDIDCIIDFSHHSITASLLSFALSYRIPVVICTTAHTDEEIAMIKDASSRIPVFFSANMSLGVALLVELAKKAAAALPDAEIEIIEKHHDRKLDAPSGTALMLADAISSVRPESYAHCGRSGQGKRTREEIGIHAIRMGNIVGEHEVIIGTQNQTITLKHEAHSRALFAEGALTAAAFLVTQDAGLYDMNSLISDKKPQPATV